MIEKSHLAPTSPYPIGLNIIEADGIYVVDADGRKYMDMISGVGVSALGHGNQRVKEAISAQLNKHAHVMVYGEFHQGIQEAFAKKLCELLPEPLDMVYFTNSGTEAVEAALKLAKRVTGRTRLVAARKSYHGSTHGSLSVTGNEVKKNAFRPLLPDVYFMEFNDMDSLNLIDEHTAGVIIETIQGDAGVRISSQEWMTALRERCNQTGAMLILDEIQCGLGRCGTWWAFEPFGLVPDILTLGKALGAGLPIGACVASSTLLSQFAHDPILGHITTFGGHPVICAAGLAGLKELEERKLVEGVGAKGQLLHDLLIQHPAVVEIRYRGLFFAVELQGEDEVMQVVSGCLENGLIGFYFLSHRSAFRLAPPFTITEEEIRRAVDIITEQLNRL